MQPKNNTPDEKDKESAANLVRKQLDSIYEGKHAVQNPHSEYLQRYHSEWQDYYQKYYERYYVGELHKAIKQQEVSGQSASETAGGRNAQEEIVNLRHNILTKAKNSAKKARKSRHFIPVISAVMVSLIVAFLQYNQMIIANVQAYVSPGAIDPQNIIVDPTVDVKVGPEPRLIVPKINVDVPVVYGIGYDEKSQLAAMEKGLAHFAIPGANSVPGQIGNTVLAGHSSNDLFDTGDYKFIFVQLPKLQKGDTIYANYKSKRYTYTVTKREVVLPSQVGKLVYKTNKPILTLITCVPIGTANKRLLITAEQVSPDPTQAIAADDSQGTSESALPGDGPTFLERLFGN